MLFTILWAILLTIHLKAKVYNTHTIIVVYDPPTSNVVCNAIRNVVYNIISNIVYNTPISNTVYNTPPDNVVYNTPTSNVVYNIIRNVV